MNIAAQSPLLFEASTPQFSPSHIHDQSESIYVTLLHHKYKKRDDFDPPIKSIRKRKFANPIILPFITICDTYFSLESTITK